MIGPGRYDAPCERTLKETQAEAVVLIVLGGNKGSGFSVSGLPGAFETTIAKLPAILRKVAEEIEADISKTKTQ